MTYPHRIFVKRAAPLPFALLLIGLITLPLSCDAGRMVAVSDDATNPNTNDNTGGSSAGGSTISKSDTGRGGAGGNSSGTGGNSTNDTSSNAPACAIVGELCEYSRDCCSGACAKTGILDRDGLDLPRCQGISGCRPAGENCLYNEECCSRTCALDSADDAYHCQPARKDCLEAGELCGPLTPRGSVECCDVPSQDLHICNRSIAGVSRCRKLEPNNLCQPDGSPCASTSECCPQHFCRPILGVGGVTECHYACATENQPCRSSTDCCSDNTNRFACISEVCKKTELNCQQLGQPCNASVPTDCCNGLCQSDPKGGGNFCVALP
jgi:hypothetical protein